MRLLRTRCPDRMFFGPYGPPFSREGRNIPIFFIALRSSGSFGHAGLLSELPEFAGFLSRRGCPVAAAHGRRSRCVHLPRHSEPGFRRFVPAPVCFACPRRAGRCGCRLRRFFIWRTFRFSGAHPCVVRWPRMRAGPSDSAAACAVMPGPGGARGDGFRGGGVFAARFFGCRELPAFHA